MTQANLSNVIIPSVKSFLYESSDNYDLTQLQGIFISSRQEIPELTDKLNVFIREFAVVTGVQLLLTHQPPSDLSNYIQINLEGSVTEAFHDEYTISVSAQGISLSAPTIAGIFYATRTLLQFTQRGNGITYGTLHDYAQVRERGLMLDVARKYFPVAWIKQMIDQMAAIKMNVLQLHLSDNQGFRLETSIDEQKYGVSFETPQVLTKSDIAELIQYARVRCIDIIPDFDSPGHMDNIISKLKQHDLLKYAGISASLILNNNLNVKSSLGVQIMADIIDDWAATFAGCRAFHIGGDEYFVTIPEFQRVSHNDAVTYLNQRANQVVAKGMEARIWNDEVYRTGGTIQPDKSTVIYYWSSMIGFNNLKLDSYAPVTTLISNGYNVLNVNQNYLYYSEGNYAPKPQEIYNEWTPMVFAGDSANFNDQQVVSDLTHVLGAIYCIWCDQGDALDNSLVYQQSKLALRAMAEKSWGKGSDTFDYATFTSLSNTWEPVQVS